MCGKKRLTASMTVEMSYLMPMVILLLMGCILLIFYFHDKNILAGAAYETAVVGSTKSREREGVKEGELERLFQERTEGKCILFSGAAPGVQITDKEVTIQVQAVKGMFSLSVEKKARITEPEKYIRDLRRIKK